MKHYEPIQREGIDPIAEYCIRQNKLAQDREARLVVFLTLISVVGAIGAVLYVLARGI